MSETESKYPDIGDYAIIGDGRCASLVSRHGSIDWLCLPRFDSASVFAAILDAEDGGRFRIAPTGTYHTKRRYVGPTNVLETTFRTASGVMTLTDVMPIPERSDRDRELLPDHEVLRRIECTEGGVEVEVTFQPRFDYGRRAPRLEAQNGVGIVAADYGQIIALQSDVPLEIHGRGVASGRATLRPGEVRFVSMTAETGPAVVAGLGARAQRRLDGTRNWWQEWIRNCSYEGPFAEAVQRSVLLLRLLIFSPSGAIVAAPTTSLPEEVGGKRNWDYRYCWLRDAAMTMRALMDQGITDEGAEFMGWMLHATRLTWPKLQVMYTVFGNTEVKEKELSHLPGYRDSRPVRIGNGAEKQLQLDVYGEVLVAALDYVDRGGALDEDEAKMLVGLGRTICEDWRQPDNGIWEVRGERTHHTLSKAFCWVSLDALLKLHERGVLEVPVEQFRSARDEIREEVERRGWNEDLQSYVAEYEGEHVDAALLLLGLNGYHEPNDERMLSTRRRVRERLGVNGLLYRYRRDDNIEGSDGGAFGICSFWEIDLLARQGMLTEAKEGFRHLLDFANDVGLYSEEIDPRTGALLGNFPQAFTHVGLINAANTIASIEKGGRPTEVGTGTGKGTL